VGAAADLLGGELGEPALDQVEPGRARRREVQVIARSLREPPPDLRRLVGPVVVQDQVHVHVPGDRPIDRLEKGPEFAGAVAPMTFADHGAGLDIERGKQRGGAVPDVIVGAPLVAVSSTGQCDT